MNNIADYQSSFRKNGYVVVPDILSPAQLEELRLMIDGVLDGSLKPAMPDPELGEAPEDFAIQWEPGLRDDATVPRREKVRVVFHLCHSHPYFWNHATRPEILDIAHALLGPELRLYTDQMFVKPAHHGSEVPFHQDSAYWPAAEPNLVSCWLALDDSTVENGCVHMIPGSHRRQVPHREFPGVQPLGLLEEDVDTSKEVPVEVKAGSAMFHHSLTIHRSFPNRSAKGRRGLVTIYLPADLQFYEDWNFRYGFKRI